MARGLSQCSQHLSPPVPLIISLAGQSMLPGMLPQLQALLQLLGLRLQRLDLRGSGLSAQQAVQVARVLQPYAAHAAVSVAVVTVGELVCCRGSCLTRHFGMQWLLWACWVRVCSMQILVFGIQLT